MPEPLPRAEQRVLIKKYQAGDDEAGKKLILHNLRFARQMASGYANNCTHLSADDLLSEATIGLHMALDKFNPDKGLNFITYARHWIRQRIIRALQNLEYPIRVPAHLQVDMHRQARGAPTKKKRFLIHAIKSRMVGSLDDCISEDGMVLHETIPAEEPQENIASDPHTMGVMRGALKRLKPKERFVIVRRYGLHDGSRWTLDQVAADMPIYNREWKKLTRERVRQIEVKALNKLRERIGGTIEEPKLQRAL